jgi:hypothetical protein
MRGDYGWYTTPPGTYAMDGDERIEQARLNGEYQGMADQAVWEAIEEARMRKHDKRKE